MALSAAMWILIIAFVTIFLGIALILGLLIWFELRHNIHVRLKEVVNGRLRIKKTRAREIVQKDGTKTIKFRKYIKGTRPFPPDQCIDLDHKGKRWVDAYILAGGALQYCEDKYQRVEGYFPFNSDDRAFLVDQIDKAKQEEGNFWDWNKIQVFVGIFAIVVIVLFGYFTFENLGETSEKVSAQAAQVSSDLVRIREIDKQIVFKEQNIEGQDAEAPVLGDEPFYED